jgi:hypothetical protein
MAMKAGRSLALSNERAGTAISFRHRCVDQASPCNGVSHSKGLTHLDAELKI